tara:strand:+ start:415 stop:582 length:168 start_codon:yes stop_codon:yes gene_type:complete
MISHTKMYWIESSKNKDTIFEHQDREVCEEICDLLNRHSKYTTYTVCPDKTGVPI